MVKVQVPNTQLVNVSFPSLSFNSYLRIIYYVPGTGLIAKTKQTPCLHRIYFSLGKIDKQTSKCTACQMEIRAVGKSQNKGDRRHQESGVGRRLLFHIRWWGSLTGEASRTAEQRLKATEAFKAGGRVGGTARGSAWLE